jgi:ATP-binding cassette subfamily B protein
MSPPEGATSFIIEAPEWADFVWGPERLSEAIEALARAAGLARPDASTAPPDEPALAVATRLGVELHPVHCDVAGLREMLRRAPPFVLPLGYGATAPMLAVVRRGVFGSLIVLGPDGRRGRVPVEDITRRLCGPLEDRESPAIDALLDEVGLAPRRRSKARARLMAERLAASRLGGGMLVRAAPWSSPLALARDAGLVPPLIKLLGARAVGLVLGLSSWVIIGGGALSGQLSPAWVGGWALLGLTGLVIGQWGAWQQGQLALRGGAAVKRLLLRGAMNLDPEHHRRQGSGGSLARVSESQAIEDLVLSGGLSVVFGAFDLLAAAGVLWIAPAGPALFALFVLCLITLVAATVRVGASRFSSLRAVSASRACSSSGWWGTAPGWPRRTPTGAPLVKTRPWRSTTCASSASIATVCACTPCLAGGSP